MITVIIAGGSGTRLWPLSTPKNPKQLLALSGERTMVQQAYDRATYLGDKVYIVTESSHSDALREQLPELHDDAFLIEPGRRGTAHCIVFALDYIARHHDKSEPIAFIHADHHIRDVKGFARSFAVAAEVSSQQGGIALIGIEPTFPSTGFGYIQRGEAIEGDAGTYKVVTFKEKPDYETALQYVESGNYLWNCGYFVGSVDIFMHEINEYSPELKQAFEKLSSIPEHSSQEYKEVYLALDNQVIDIALMEKAKDLAVVSADFDWMDIGNFKDLHDVVPKNEAGNYAKGEGVYLVESENLYVRNEEPGKPIAVIGLDNVVVVNTPDGLLVARKDVSAKCGDIAKQIQA